MTSDAYVVVKRRITVLGTNNTNRLSKKLIFGNNAPFRSCLSKMNYIFIDNSENFGIVIPMYNFF